MAPGLLFVAAWKAHTRRMEMILVTGAAGLNGSAVVRQFSRNGVGVRALVRDRSKAVAIADLPYVELVEGDMARTETLDRVLGGIDRALMISSPNLQMLETQCQFVDACKAAGVAHVVKFSGKESNVGFDANKFLFTRMHEEIERYLEASASSGRICVRASSCRSILVRRQSSPARACYCCHSMTC